MRCSSMNTDYSKETAFSIAAVVCGALSITLGCCYLSLPFAALSILFVCLGRYKGQPFSGLQRAAVILSIIGTIYGAVCYYNLYLTITEVYNRMMTDPEYFNQMNEKFRQLYGMNIQDFLDMYMPSAQAIFRVK